MKKAIYILLIFALIVSPSLLIAGSDKCKDELKEAQTRIVELEKENAELKETIAQYEADNCDELLMETIIQLEESNNLLETLNNENISLKTLNKKYKSDLEAYRYEWQLGAGVSYPMGFQLYLSRVFSRFGIYGSAGANSKSPYVTIGAYIKK